MTLLGKPSPTLPSLPSPSLSSRHKKKGKKTDTTYHIYRTCNCLTGTGAKRSAEPQTPEVECWKTCGTECLQAGNLRGGLCDDAGFVSFLTFLLRPPPSYLSALFQSPMLIPPTTQNMHLPNRHRRPLQTGCHASTSIPADKLLVYMFDGLCASWESERWAL